MNKLLKIITAYYVQLSFTKDNSESSPFSIFSNKAPAK